MGNAKENVTKTAIAGLMDGWTRTFALLICLIIGELINVRTLALLIAIAQQRMKPGWSKIAARIIAATRLDIAMVKISGRLKSALIMVALVPNVPILLLSMRPWSKHALTLAQQDNALESAARILIALKIILVINTAKIMAYIMISMISSAWTQNASRMSAKCSSRIAELIPAATGIIIALEKKSGKTGLALIKDAC
jgi:hypothetical protein